MKTLLFVASRPVIASRVAGLKLNDCIALANELYLSHRDPKAVPDHILLALLHRSAGKAIKAVRKNKPDRFSDNIATTFLFAAALAGRKGIDLEKELWIAYPGECPYCHVPTCACDRIERPERRTTCRTVRRVPPKTVKGFQEMHATIYPPFDGLDTIGHLMEEFAELHAAFHQQGKQRGLSHRPAASFEDVFKVEMIDVFSHLLKVSTYMKVDLEAVLLARSTTGCHQCGSLSCACTVDDFLGDRYK